MRNMVDRRKSEEYRQVSAYIPKDLYRKFKSALALKELPQNEVLEKLIEQWLQESNQKDD